MEQPPAVSVIMATYRRPHLLPRAVNSVLAQTFTDFELIIVDDASPDETPAVVAAMTDPRIRYMRLTQNGGHKAALNAGVQQARGEILVFVDDDDRVEPEFLAELADALRAAPVTVGFALPWRRVAALDATGKERTQSVITYAITTRGPHPGHNLLIRPHGSSSGLAVRRAAFHAVDGFDPTFRAVGDTDLLIRMAQRYEYLVVPKPLYVVTFIEGDQLTKPSATRGAALETMAARHAALMRPYPWVIANWLIQSGRNYYAAGVHREGRRVMRKLVGRAPWSLRNWAIWAVFEVGRLLPTPWRRRVFRPHR